MSDQDQKIIPLRKPLTLGELSFDSITVREPTIDELDQALKQPTQIATAMALLATVSGIPIALIKKVPTSEFTQATNALSSFMPDSPVIGDNLPLT